MMERIDKSNYEAWLLDRLEGRLSSVQEAMLDDFLRAHPELDASLDELPTLDAYDAVLAQADKDDLKRGLPPGGAVHEGNIEDFLIALIEGDLDAGQADAVHVFLLAHPQYGKDHRQLLAARVEADAAICSDKDQLHRDLPPTGLPTTPYLDDFLVARQEGDLTDAQEAALDGLLARDPQASRESALMQLTRIAADPIAYPDKDELKKAVPVIPIFSAGSAWATVLRVAAVVLLLLGSGIWLILQGPDRETQIAEQRLPATGQLPDDGVPVPDQAKQEIPEEAITPASDVATPAQTDLEPALAAATPRSVLPSKESGMPTEEIAAPPVKRAVAETMPALAVLPREHTLPLPGKPLPPSVPATNMEEELYAAVPDAATGKPVGTADALSPGELLASTLRQRLLDKPAAAPGPLDGSDALALVDKGLRMVSGGDAGVEVVHGTEGTLRRWDLRLGRNFSISARR